MRVLRYEDLKERGLGFSRPHLWRLMKAGQFPRPIKVAGGAANGWIEEEVDQHIRDRMAERDAALGKPKGRKGGRDAR